MRRGENQTITGTVNIESDALIENLYVSPESYGAIDLQQLLYGSMLKSVDQVRLRFILFKNKLF